MAMASTGFVARWTHWGRSNSTPRCLRVPRLVSCIRHFTPSARARADDLPRGQYSTEQNGLHYLITSLQQAYPSPSYRLAS